LGFGTRCRAKLHRSSITRRMQPAVCRFISAAIYEDRIESFADCANQRIDALGELTGTGIRYVLVAREGNARVWRGGRDEGSLVEDLLKGSAAYASTSWPTSGWASSTSPRARRRWCASSRWRHRSGRSAREPGVPVQQEPAECGGVTSAMFGGAGRNPALLNVRCGSAEQMRLLNALCWFVEMAGKV
jgi:hypothetical protein